MLGYSLGNSCSTYRDLSAKENLQIHKVTNVPNHGQSNLDGNGGCKLQKNHKSKYFLSGWVINISGKMLKGQLEYYIANVNPKCLI